VVLLQEVISDDSIQIQAAPPERSQLLASGIKIRYWHFIPYFLKVSFPWHQIVGRSPQLPTFTFNWCRQKGS